MLAGIMARPAATSERTNSGVISAGKELGETLEMGGARAGGGGREGGIVGAAGMLLVEVIADVVIFKIPDSQTGSRRYLHVLADGDEFHFGRDYPLAGVLKLSHNFARLGPKRTAQPGRPG